MCTRTLADKLSQMVLRPRRRKRVRLQQHGVLHADLLHLEGAQLRKHLLLLRAEKVGLNRRWLLHHGLFRLGELVHFRSALAALRLLPLAALALLVHSEVLRSGLDTLGRLPRLLVRVCNELLVQQQIVVQLVRHSGAVRKAASTPKKNWAPTF